MTWEPLTEEDRLQISRVVHQNYYMPDVFETVATIVRAHIAEHEAELVAARDLTSFHKRLREGWEVRAEQAEDERDALRAQVERVRALAETLGVATEGPLRVGTALWPECDRDAYSLAIEEAQTALRGALDPE